MQNKYYDTWKFQQIVELSKKNPKLSDSKFREYLGEYPKDYCAYVYFVGNLITLGEFDEASKVLDKLEIEYKTDKGFFKFDSKVEILAREIIHNRLRLFSYMERYEEFYKYYLKNEKEIDTEDYKGALAFCLSKMGKLEYSEEDENHPYVYTQIVDYKESNFFNHIKRHLADYNSSKDERNSSIFSCDFPLKKIVDEVKKYIPSDTRLYPGFYENIYVFKYDGCGRDTNRLVDYFKVICFHNTENIITICPSLECENFAYIDLNYMRKKDDQNKQNFHILMKDIL